MIEGTPLVGGAAAGEVVTLDEPLSFWGGLDPTRGVVVDKRHPQCGVSLAGKVLVMPFGRGSSSSSSVLSEALRLGNGPIGIVLQEPDEIIVIGVLVAVELYGTTCPVVVVTVDDYLRVERAERVNLRENGVLELS